MNSSVNILDVNNLLKVKMFLENSSILIDDLKYILIKSESILVLNFISYKLKEFDQDDSILKILIGIIKNPNFNNKKAKLISVCEEYDCSEYFDDFINIIIEEDGESCLNAIDVVSKMNILPNNTRINMTIEKLYKEILSHPKKDKNDYLLKLIEFLERYR
jgi:hypothetical protein